MKISYWMILVLLSVAPFFSGCNDGKTAEKQKSEGTESFVEHVTFSDQEEALLDLVQKQTFEYFWSGAEPVSGMARERIHMDGMYPEHDQNVITLGGSGFGVMAILVGVERGFITREQALERYQQIVAFLEKADRFHGAWPHWMEATGKVKPFSPKDDGGDLVETAFMVQGLLTVAEYFRNGNEEERRLVNSIETLWKGVEWSWYTKGGQNVLYWHWSTDYEWDMNFPVGGYNECLIMYILAASSPSYPIRPEVYDLGWARGGSITHDTVYYGLHTVLDHYEHSNDPVGPLFWAHYSYLGLNPAGLSDKYGDYWKVTRNHALINYRYALDNPEGYRGYGQEQWGLTSSYSMNGYAGHHPGHDLGVISPTAALSSFPYTPRESMQFLKYLYLKADSLIGKYGPYDAYSVSHKWFTPRYLAIDQGPIPVMIENYRSGLIWKLFMQNEDVRNGLRKLGFSVE